MFFCLFIQLGILGDLKKVKKKELIIYVITEEF